MMSVTFAYWTVPQIDVMYCVVLNKFDPKYMVCVWFFVLFCQHFYTPSWPLPICSSGISRKGLVSPGIWHYKNCVIIFSTILLLRPSSPRIPKEKVVHHHAVMSSFTSSHLLFFQFTTLHFFLWYWVSKKKSHCLLLLSFFMFLTPVAGLIFKTKNRAIFLQRFFGREITAREQLSRAVILARF